MIPRKIHYVWVGGKPLPALAEQCIASWKEKLPDFEIKRWDETNSPMNHPYVKAMYDQKLWAFVSDYIRFWALTQEGGVYLDTDTVVLKHFDDELLSQTFFGKTPDGFIGCGVIGAPAGDSFIKSIKDYYDKADKDTTRTETSPIIVTKLYEQLKPVGVKIFSTEYFNPCRAEEKRTPEKLAVAYTDNLWAESWVTYRGLRKFARKIGIMSFLISLAKALGIKSLLRKFLKV